jgi:hypothetical protein
MIPYLNSASYSSFVQNGILKGVENQHSVKTEKSIYSFEINSVEKELNQKSIQPQLQFSSPINQSNNSGKLFLEMNIPQQKIFNLKNDSSKSVNKHAGDKTIVNKESSEIKKGYYIFDPSFESKQLTQKRLKGKSITLFVYDKSVLRNEGKLVDLII